MNNHSWVRTSLLSVVLTAAICLDVGAGAAQTLRMKYEEAKDIAINEVLTDVLAARANSAWTQAKEKAEKLGGNPEMTPIKEAADDLAVPEAPALSVLGVTPETVIRPTSPRQFAVGLLEGVDPNGELQTGMALEANPFLLLGGNDVTIADYNKNFGTRFLSRIGLSFATSKGSNDDESLRLAAGLTVTPWDRGDPRLSSNLTGCLADRLAPVTSSIHQLRAMLQPRFEEAFDPADEQFDALEASAQDDASKEAKMLVLVQQGKEAVSAVAKSAKLPGAELETAAKAIKKCRTDHEDQSWNASAWNIGLAPALTSADGDVGSLEWSGLAVYSTLAYGFEEVPGLQNSAQLLLHGRYHMNEDAPLAGMAGSFVEQDTLTLSGQLRIAGFDVSRFDDRGGSDLNFLGEVAYIDKWRDSGSDESVWRYTVGAEYRLTESLYLKASLGTQDGDDPNSDESFALFNVKWNFSEAPSLGR